MKLLEREVMWHGPLSNQRIYGIVGDCECPMTPSGKELIFDVEEMHTISVHCPKCGTGILFDVKEPHTALPVWCPACKEHMEFEGEVLGQYRKFYQRMIDSKRKFHFRVSIPA